MKIDPLAGPLSEKAINLGIKDAPLLAAWIKNLPYGRNTNRADYASALTENKGTCSTKHALYKAIADENHWPGVELYMAMFWMNAETTPRIKQILLNHNMKEIPEAHTYLRIHGVFTDLTGLNNSLAEEQLEDEMEISPTDIGMMKEIMHKGFIAEWIEECELEWTEQEIWKIREECIGALAGESLIPNIVDYMGD